MDTKYINLKFKSNNNEIEVGKEKPFRLLNIEGLSEVQIELSHDPNVRSDGSKTRNKRVAFRPIMIECEYTRPDNERQRRFAASFFNVHNEGLLQVDYMGIKRQIPYEVEGYSARLENIHRPFRFLVHLYCSKPYWLDVDETIEEVVSWTGGMTFPWILPTTFATAGERILNIYNGGDVDSPATYSITGPAINPRVENENTGEYMQINAELSADDTVVITTEYGNKRVELNGESAFNLLELPGSSFMLLATGDNVIELKTDDVSSNAYLKVSYRNRYIGV